MQNVDGYAGYNWLSQEYDMSPVQPLRVPSDQHKGQEQAAQDLPRGLQR